MDNDTIGYKENVQTVSVHTEDYMNKYNFNYEELSNR